ncbi:MAG: hypothetical protein EBT15_10315, partial [Betaproteobacteria bacterium]|nr:hypothetical protein [Betaproteobacteria bacterium]
MRTTHLRGRGFAGGRAGRGGGRAGQGGGAGLDGDQHIGLTNAYFFRGLNYTRERPAVQGGFDITHSSGFYAGVWASNVDTDSIPNSNAEIDVYGGYARPIGPITADVGV